VNIQVENRRRREEKSGEKREGHVSKKVGREVTVGGKAR
jgi:hypothetical protein